MRTKKLVSLFPLLFTILISGCSFFESEKATITLNSSDILLNIADEDLTTFQLEPTIENRNEEKRYTFKFATKDYSIASVNTTGLITAKSVGKTEIKVYVKEDASIFTWANVRVINVENVKVRLNCETASVPIDGNYQLNATVSHAADPSVTWKSSNESIATVNNNGLVKVSNSANVDDTVTITATSVEDTTKSASCVITVIEKPLYKYDYTMMYYMSGSTLEYDESQKDKKVGFISQDIAEIASVDYPSNVKVLIETGGSQGWSLGSNSIDGATSISGNYLQRWEVVNHKIKLIETLDTNHMASEESLESYLKWGLKNYPGAQMGLVFSGHGGGVGGCCMDNNYPLVSQFVNYYNSLNTNEILTATKNALETSYRNKFDWVGFDCCIMSCADMASVLTDVFDYMVASQETELSLGWDHDVYLSSIVKNPQISPTELLPKVSQSFLDFYEKHYCKTYALGYDACVSTSSVMDLRKMPQFTNAFNSYVKQIGSGRTTFNDVKNAYNSCVLKFGANEYGLADFKEFISKLSSYHSTVSAEYVLSALEDVVIKNVYCKYYTVNPCGLDIFTAYITRGSLAVSKADYTGSNATRFTDWQNMLLNYGSFSW